MSRGEAAAARSFAISSDEKRRFAYRAAGADGAGLFLTQKTVMHGWSERRVFTWVYPHD